jgi:hypothetical protein
MTKKILLFGIVGLLAYFLVSADRCVYSTEKLVHKTDTMYIHQQFADTVFKRIYTMTILRDTVTVTRFVERDSAYIFFADTSTGTNRDIRIWQGSELSSNDCRYNYTIGVLNDTVQFLDMQSECQQIDTIETQIITYTDRPIDQTKKNNFYGGLFTNPIAKDWYLPGVSLTYTRKQNVYLGLDYAPFQRSFYVRAGVRIHR